MPGVAFERAAVDVPAKGVDFSGKNPFYCHHDQKNRKREPLGRVMWGSDFQNGVPGDDSSGNKQRSSGEESSEGFDATVAVGVVFVGWTQRELEADPSYQRSKNIGRRLDAISHQRVGISNEADGDFHGHEHEVDAYGQQPESHGFSRVDHAARRFFGSRMPSPSRPAQSRPSPTAST